MFQRLSKATIPKSIRTEKKLSSGNINTSPPKRTTWASYFSLLPEGKVCQTVTRNSIRIVNS